MRALWSNYTKNIKRHLEEANGQLFKGNIGFQKAEIANALISLNRSKNELEEYIKSIQECLDFAEQNPIGKK